MKGFDILQAKNSSKVRNSIDLLTDRVNEHTMSASDSGKRDARETRSSTDVQNDVLRANLRRDNSKRQ